MKKNILNRKTAGVVVTTFLLFITTFSSAATFTAVASGNWSNSATWGGSVPPTTIISDQVIIPANVNVTADNSITLNGTLAVLNVNGGLSGPGSMLTVNSGTITGSGIINTGNVIIETSAIIPFTGSLTANVLTCNLLNLPIVADIMVIQTMNLNSGVLSLQTGGSLDVAEHAAIVVSGGVVAVSGGTVGLASIYNVIYVSTSALAGVELTGPGLYDVAIDVGAGNTVTLTSDLTVQGMLSLTSGTLALSGKDLTLTGNISATGSGTISSSAASDVAVVTGSSVSGLLKFSLADNVVNNFTVNIGGNGSVMLGSDIVIQGMLNLVSGYLDAGSYNVEVAMGGSVSGMSNTSYVITGLSGSLSMHLTAGAPAYTLFPVGTSSNFFPAEIYLNPGSASGEVFVGVNADVYSAGTGGVDITNTQPVVDATWFIDSQIATNLDMNIELMWPASAEVNAFNRNTAYISHNLAGFWDVTATASASIEANGMYSLARNNITYLSPFAVFDQNTIPTDVVEIADQVSFDIYPNPASDHITITFDYANYEPMYIEVLNILGSQLYSDRITNTNTTIPVAEYIPGNYFVRIFNDNTSIVKKFVKDTKVK